MTKSAVYCMTRNIYHTVIPSLKSLLKNGHIDKVYMVIEDDDIGIQLPEWANVEFINVRDQKYFGKDCPNIACKWTYMVLMRTVLADLLPNEEKVLSLDCDTLVMGNVSRLWDLDLGDNYLAACREPAKSWRHHDYVNCGVVFWNLKQMRDGMMDKIVNALNSNSYMFAEQDCVNEFCAEKMLLLPADYNVCRFTDRPEYTRIRHFAAQPTWWDSEPEVFYYKKIPWEACKT